MNDKPAPKFTIYHGINASTRAGGQIGGVDSEIDGDGRPIVILSVMAAGEDDSTDLDLHEGDTFELGPELWEVAEILDPNTADWTAVLNQLR